MSYDWIKEIGSADLAKNSHHRETVVQAMNIQRGESYGGRFLPIITKSACGSEEGLSIPMGMRHLMCHVYVSHKHSLRISFPQGFICSLISTFLMS